jgi:hypothetical protein
MRTANEQSGIIKSGGRSRCPQTAPKADSAGLAIFIAKRRKTTPTVCAAFFLKGKGAL